MVSKNLWSEPVFQRKKYSTSETNSLRAVSKKQITLKKRSKKVSKKTNKKSVKKKVWRTPKKPRALDLRKFIHNPVITPASGSYWESEAVFNPGAVRHGGRVHLFYRALGPDGISR